MSARDAVVETPARSTRMRPLRAWRGHHAWSIRHSLRQLLKRPLGSALTIVVMGFALALPLAFLLLLVNMQRLSAALGESQAVSVFLKADIDAPRAQALAARLRARDDISTVVVKTPQQGLAELAAVQGFGEALRVMPGNPLPFVLLVQPRVGAANTQVVVLAAALRAQPGVDLVQDDGAFRTRLDALVALGRRVTVLLATMLALAALLVVGNTVRLDIRGRSEEIAVQQLVGASRGFIRRPFLYEGFWYGLAGGLVAVVLVVGLEFALAAPVRELARSYAGRLDFGALDGAILIAVPPVSAALGWIGAWLASARRISMTMPQ